jgi:hypothetical protein
MPTITITGPGSRPEGTGGTTPFQFTVTRSGDLSALTIVDYWTWPFGVGANGEIDAHGMSGATSGSVYFQPGVTSQIITLNVIADSGRELDESFNVSLSNPRNATIEGGTARATILDDDGGGGATSLSWGNSTQGLAHNEGNSGATPFTYVINRGGDTSGTTSVDWGVVFGQTDPQDFAGPFNGSVVFGPGELSKSITINVAADLAVEGDEAFQVALSNAPGVALPPPIPGKILNDDGGAAGSTSLSIVGPGSGAEGTGGTTTGFTFTVVRDGDVSGTSIVDYWLWPFGAGSQGQVDVHDFIGQTSGSVYFQAGQRQAVLTIPVGADSTVEQDETFNVSLSNPRGGMIAAGGGTAQATIVNDDGGPPAATTLSWGNPGGVHQNEGNQTSNAPPTDFVYVLNRSGDLSGVTTVDWVVERGPVDENDFLALPFGQVRFEPGETSKQIVLKVNGDLAVEPDEAFRLLLSNAVGATAPPPNTGTIVNDDGGAPGPTSVSISGSFERPEGNSGSSFWEYAVRRSGDLSGTTLVDYYTVGDVTGPHQSTTPDYRGGTGTLYFQPGETEKLIRLEIVSDTTPEPSEAFIVGLSNARGATIGTQSAGGRILDDDGWVMG